jgi:hypothetical protein
LKIFLTGFFCQTALSKIRTIYFRFFGWGFGRLGVITKALARRTFHREMVCGTTNFREEIKMNENMENRQEFDDLANFLQDTLGVDVRQYVDNEELDEFEARLLMRNDILKALLTNFQKGEQDEDFRLPDDFDVVANVSMLKGEDDGCTRNFNIMLTPVQVARIKEARGNAIKSVFDDLKDFAEEATKLCTDYKKGKDDDPSFVDKLCSLMVGRGIEALDAGVAKVVIDTVIEHKSTIAGAIVGIKTMQPQLVLKAVADLLSVFTNFLNRNKSLVGLVLNETEHDITVKNWRLGTNGENTTGWDSSDLYMRHGQMRNFMNDETTSPPVQVAKLPGEKMVYAGLYEMSNRKSALLGVNTLMRLSVGSDKVDFYSCSPYSNPNGVVIKLNNGLTPKQAADVYDKSYTISSQADNERLKVMANANSSKGSKAYAICLIEPVE